MTDKQITEHVEKLKKCLFNGDEDEFLKCTEDVEAHFNKDDIINVCTKLCHSYGLFSFRTYSTDRDIIKSETHKRHKMLFDWLSLPHQLKLMTGVEFDIRNDLTPEHITWLKLTPQDIHKNTLSFSVLCQCLIQRKNIEALEALFDCAAKLSPEFTPQYFLTLPTRAIYLAYSEKNSYGSFVVCESKDDAKFIVAGSVWWNYSEELRPFVERYENELKLHDVRNVLNDEFRSVYSAHGDSQMKVEDYQINRLPQLDALVTRQILNAQGLDTPKTKSVKKM